MKRLKLAILLLMLALLPLRGLTAVTIGDCAAGQHGAAHQQDAHDHDHGDAKHDHEHCASASFVASASALPLPAPASSGRVEQRHSFLAGFVADHLDPPPLTV